MSAKVGFQITLVVAILGLYPVQGQDYTGPASPAGMDPAAKPGPAGEAPHPAMAEAPGALSGWITNFRPDCCCCVGADGPISSEVYLRTGPSLPIGGGVFNNILETGWEIQGGARSLFFNPPATAAWTADISLSYTYNHGESTVTVPILAPGIVQMHVRDLNRTFASLGVGREWYMPVPATSCGPRWRTGFDLGGRLGTGKVDFAETTHHTDVLYGTFFGLHTDVEMALGCCTMVAGFRAEWDYTFSDILQNQNNADLEDLNLLVTLGIRF